MSACQTGSVTDAGSTSWLRTSLGDGRHTVNTTRLSPLPVGLRQGALRANRQRYIDQAQVVKQRLRLERTTYLIEFFEKHSCADCGESDPVVLEFDHLRDKRFSIGSKLCTATWNDILAEIEKCEFVCANHRRRTAQCMGSVRATLTQL